MKVEIYIEGDYATVQFFEDGEPQFAYDISSKDAIEVARILEAEIVTVPTGYLVDVSDHHFLEGASFD